MLNHSSFLMTLAGISFFMYGMTLASDNLQKLAANRIRDLIAKLSDKPFWGVFVGIALTVLIQSSGAVTSMLVGLGTAGVVTLQQVMGVILGTAIGTTITVQLLSLNVAQYGLPIFTFSFIFYFLSKKRGFRRTMGVLMGFGLIFWGLELIGIGTHAIRETNYFVNILDYLKENPLVAICITAIFTAVVHSSAVTVGFAMSLAGSGLISITDAIYWVYGANIGTTATALIAATGGNYVARQVAWAHCCYKTLSVALFYFFTTPFAQMIQSTNVQRDVANAHTFYNIIAALIFLPFIKIGSKTIEKLFPPKSDDKEFSVKFLDRGTYESGSIVIAHAERELLRMADIVISMVKDSMKLFKGEDKDLYEDVKERDDKVDLLNREISLFLTRYMENTETSSYDQMIRLISFASDLESAADVIDKNIIDMAGKKHNLKLEFSKQGWSELEKMHKMVLELVTLSVSSFQRKDVDLAEQVIHLKRSIRLMERNLRETHIERLVAGQKASINTSSIHLDLLGEYRRIAGLMTNHIYNLLNETDRYSILHKSES